MVEGFWEASPWKEKEEGRKGHTRIKGGQRVCREAGGLHPSLVLPAAGKGGLKQHPISRPCHELGPSTGQTEKQPPAPLWLPWGPAGQGRRRPFFPSPLHKCLERLKSY